MNLDLQMILTSIAAAAPAVALTLKILGTLVVFGQSIVPLTPAKNDQEKWDKLVQGYPILGQLIAALHAFSVIQKK